MAKPSPSEGSGPRPGSTVRRIAAMSLVEQATIEIRRAIISGALPPGEEFSQRQIAAMLGVSFIPVREALHRLEGQGLIQLQSGRSASVAPLTRDDLASIYRLRRVIEPEIAARACPALADSELDELEAIEQTFGDVDTNIDDVFEAHHQFHLRLLAPAASAWDIRVLEDLWRAAERYIRLAFGALDDRRDEHQRRHQAHGDLLDAFRTRDPDGVREAWLAHLAGNELIAEGAIPADSERLEADGA